MQPEIDYIKIGQRIKAARQEKGAMLKLDSRKFFGNASKTGIRLGKEL